MTTPMLSTLQRCPVVSSAKRLGRVTAVLIAAIITLSGCSMLPWSSDLKPVEQSLTENDPVTFAMEFVAHVQPGTSIELYERFLHPNVRKMLKDVPDIRAKYHRDAQQENRIIAQRNLLAGATVKTMSHRFNDTIHVQYRIDTDAAPMLHESVYPDSNLAGKNIFVKKGEIVLADDEGQWRVVGHHLL